MFTLAINGYKSDSSFTGRNEHEVEQKAKMEGLIKSLSGAI